MRQFIEKIYHFEYQIDTYFSPIEVFTTDLSKTNFIKWLEYKDIIFLEILAYCPIVDESKKGNNSFYVQDLKIFCDWPSLRPTTIIDRRNLAYRFEKDYM